MNIEHIDEDSEMHKALLAAADATTVRVMEEIEFTTTHSERT